ncbi:hypothetical protein ABIE27_000351 [Paenibacillus sp. 4624]|uniref:hypothetical protein n=1 Tax=Paenibacillus sp. 4624 TaxID=3156453 RepID=UPI003D20800B
MIQKGDLVMFSAGGVGKIKRMSKDRSWADVNCGSWSKRVPDPDKNLQLYKNKEEEQS